MLAAKLSMKILTTPWKDDLLELVANSKTSIRITSPFVKENICRDLIKAKQVDSKIELVTSFKLANIYSGSLDLSALELIILNKGNVRNFAKLHSKIYLFDNEKAVVTSGNLTNGGLERNFEYGVLVDDKVLISQICNDFDTLTNDENTGTIKLSDIETVRSILANIPKAASVKLPSYRIVDESPEQLSDVVEFPIETFSKTLNGWKLDIFDCLNNLPQQQFTLANVYSFENRLKEKHPLNNNVKDKIRQQLQALRDLGLVEFLGDGKYKKLWK